MKPWQSVDGAVVTDTELTPADLHGLVSPAGYARFYVRKPADVTVTVKVGTATVVAFSGHVAPLPGKARPFEVRVRLHPDIDAAKVPPDPAIAEAESRLAEEG